MTTERVGSEIEEPEGIGPEEDASWGDYPLDTVLIRTESRTVDDVLRRIKQGRYVLDPEFQRDFIWTDLKQSKLIESVLMRIPLPVFLPCGRFRRQNDRSRWFAAAVHV